MKIEKFCYNCSNSKCSNCFFGIISETGTIETKTKSDLINLEDKFFYFHQNKSVLNDSNDHFIDKKVLVIGCGSIKRYHVLKSLKTLNFEKIICLCREKTWAYGYFDDWIFADHENMHIIEETLKKVLEYEKKNCFKFNAIFTYDDYSILVASYLANYFNLPSIPFELAKAVKNKFELRKLCELNGITTPKFCLIKYQEIRSFLDYFSTANNDILQSSFFSEINYPLIVKNSNGSGKDFIFKCINKTELMDCLRKSIYRKIDLLIEEFYEGIEIDLEVLIQNNNVKFVAVSDNFPAQEPSFNEQGGVCPSIKLNFDQQQQVISLVKYWIKKLGFRDACLHFEAKCKPQLIGKENFFMPIEINQRIGGAETWSMILSSFNVNLVHEAAKISLGIKLNELDLSTKSINPRWYSISHNFLIKSKSVINNLIINQNRILNDKNIIEVCFFKTLGSIFINNESIGWLVLKNGKESVENILTSLEALLESIKIVLKPIS